MNFETKLTCTTVTGTKSATPTFTCRHLSYSHCRNWECSYRRGGSWQHTFTTSDSGCSDFYFWNDPEDRLYEEGVHQAAVCAYEYCVLDDQHGQQRARRTGHFRPDSQRVLLHTALSKGKTEQASLVHLSSTPTMAAVRWMDHPS